MRLSAVKCDSLIRSMSMKFIFRNNIISSLCWLSVFVLLFFMLIV
jgi:hypothetical protein